MADQDAAHDHSGPRPPTLAAMMSAFTMFPQSDEPPPARRWPMPTPYAAEVEVEGAPPEPHAIVDTPLIAAAPLALMPESAFAREPEPVVPTLESAPEPHPEPHPEPPPESPPESPPQQQPLAAPTEKIEPLYHAPATSLPPPYLRMLDPVAPAIGEALPTLAPVAFDASERLDRPSRPRPASNGLIRWKVATAVCLALAVAAGVFAFVPRSIAPTTAIAAIGVVNAPAPLYLAEIDGAATLRLTALATIAVPNGRDLQLWIIPPGDQPAVSLGVLPSRGATITLPSVPPEGTRFVISLEPRGGTSAGRITGQVLYGGTLANR